MCSDKSLRSQNQVDFWEKVYLLILGSTNDHSKSAASADVAVSSRNIRMSEQLVLEEEEDW